MSLNEAEVAQIRRAGEHFKKVLRETFELFPRSARTIAGLARWTKINKSTCQRFVQALTKSSDGIDVIVTLPGISGLKQLEKTINQLLQKNEGLKSFTSMVAEYEDLILEFATSQSELKRSLQKFQNRSSRSFSSYNRKLKKDAYELNRELTGESVDTYVGAHFFRINKDDKNFLDEMIVSQKVGVELTKFARPFVQNFGGNLTAISINDPVTINSGNLDSFKRKESGEYLLEEFSSPGIENCYAGLGNLKDSLVYNHTLENNSLSNFDIALAHYDYKTQPNPLTDEHKIICQSIMQRSPAKRLVLMALVDKWLDKGSDIQSGCYPASVRIHEKDHQPEDLWSERFTDVPEIKLFQPGDGSLSAKLRLNNIDRLIDLGFELLDEEPSNFTGYFIETEYPLWLTSHRFYFKF